VAANLSAHDIDILKQLEIFASVDEAELTAMASSSFRRALFVRGEVIYHQEDLSGSLFIVLEGVVRILLSSPAGKQLTTGWIFPGTPWGYFGTMALISGCARAETAIAFETCITLIMTRDEFLRFLERHPEVKDVLLQVEERKWRRLMERLGDLAFLDVPARVAKMLLRYSDSEGAPVLSTAGHYRIDQRELASLVGATREMVNKTLRAFANQSWIDLQQGRVTVLRPDSLENLIDQRNSSFLAASGRRARLASDELDTSPGQT
jgi:CRP-like cAMP-binding protein